MNYLALTSDVGESPGVIRDANGVPVEWTLLKVGDNPICQEGRDGVIALSAADMRSIIGYHEKKSELIPIDSEQYLFALAQSKKLDEAEALRLFPGAVAARESGATFQYAMHEMSLSAVCALFVNYRRREDKDAHLTRRPKPEILELIDRRVDELAEKFLLDGQRIAHPADDQVKQCEIRQNVED